MAGIFRAFQRHWKVIVCGLLAGLLVGAFLASREPLLYAAYGSVTIPGGSDKQLTLKGLPGQRGRLFELRQQALYNFKSVPLLTRVAVDVGMLPASSLANAGAEMQPAPQRLALARLRTGLTVDVDPDSEVVTISFVSGNAAFSAEVVNRLIADAIDYALELRFHAIQRGARWPNQQLGVLQQDVARAENHLLDVQRQLNLPLFNNASGQLSQSAIDMGRAVTRAQMLRIRAQSQYEQLQHVPAENLTTALEADPALGSVGLRTTGEALRKTQTALAAREATEGPRNPNIVALRANLTSLQATLAAEHTRALMTARQQFQAAQQNEDQLRRVLAEENGHLATLAEKDLQLRQLQREFFETRLLYTTLYTKVRTVSLDAGLRPSQISLLNMADAPEEAISRPWWRFELQYGALGLLGGMVLALGLTNLRVSNTERIEQMEAAMSLPTLAALPTMRLMSDSGWTEGSTAAQNLQLLGQPESAFSEGIRTLRTNLRMTTLEQEPRFILFTSATPSEGKTTVSSNYAAALAESGSPTLLIDADMHRPNLHHRFGVSGAVGLSNILSGAATLPLSVQSIAGAGALDLLVAGPVPPAPGHLLEQDHWVALLREAATRYQHIVIDSPPVLAVNDGVTLARHVDAVVYVIRQNKIPRQVARRGRDKLASSGAPLVGVVINALRADTEG